MKKSLLWIAGLAACCIGLYLLAVNTDLIGVLKRLHGM